MAIRLALMDHHYRTDWGWTPDKLVSAQQRLQSWRSAMGRNAGIPAKDTIAAVRAALRNDLDVPTALGAVDTWVAASLAIRGDDTQAPVQMAQMIDALLGVRL